MEEWAFLMSVLAAPGDPAPLLVFADWLEARGERRAERGRQRATSHPIGY